jgi:hypothetical protein
MVPYRVLDIGSSARGQALGAAAATAGPLWLTDVAGREWHWYPDARNDADSG